MSDQPIDDPFLGAGLDDPDPQASVFTVPYGTFPPALTYSSGYLEVQAGLDEVPPLVGDQFSDEHSPLTPDLAECHSDIAEIRRTLENLMVPAATLHNDDVPGKYFLPQSALETIITRRAIERVLAPFDRHHAVSAPGSYLKVLAILALIDKPSSLSDLVAHKVTDDCLPLQRLSVPGGNLQVQSARNPGVPCEPFQKWDGEDIASFLSTQWKVMAPTFKDLSMAWGRRGSLFLDLPDDAILPFTRADRFNSGGYGTVYRVEIHDPAYHTPQFKFQVPCRFAIKKLHSTDGHAFENEVRALQLLNSKPHRHIVSLLGSYRLRDTYHLMFDWADSDLGMFWRLNPRPQRDRGTAGWVARQSMGLVDALSVIHGLESRDEDSRGSSGWQGWHGDIKPSNILFFGNGNSGILKLTDFGLSSFHKPGTPHHRHTEDGPIRYTPTYRAPEFDLSGDAIGSSIDIWSLGCVFLELTTWYLLGVRGLGQLADCRTDGPEQTVRTGDAFFELLGQSGRHVARLKPVVEDWITRLQSHRHSTRFTDDVLRVVHDNMLVVKSTRRSSALDVLGQLARICQDLDNDDSFVASRETRGLAFGDEGNWDDSGHSSVSDKNHTKVHSNTQSSHANSRKRKGKSEATTTDQTTSENSKRHHQRKLACPYRKAGFAQSDLSRACMGPGWGSIHHFKEHLIRCHTPPAFKSPLVCGRCLEGFKSQDLLFQHSREDPQCLIKSPEIINGQVSLEQAINLRSMKRKGSDMTQEDMWFEIFQIIFPSKEPPTSPYHEDLTVSSLNTISTQSSTGISEYKDHLLRPMSENEQRALGERLGKAIGISNPDLCKMLAAAFREQQLKDIQEFDKQKLEPVYGIPVLDDDTPKAEAAVEAQLAVASPGNGNGDGDETEWWMKGFVGGESFFSSSA